MKDKPPCDDCPDKRILCYIVGCEKESQFYQWDKKLENEYNGYD